MTLSELIMTRISHDLAGICGALYNTAELLEIDETFVSDAGPLIKSSTGALTARLKFFRALFGLEGAPIDNDIVDKYLQTLSARFELKGRVNNRMQLAGILICADMMIRGGQIDVRDSVVSGCGLIKENAQLSMVLSGNFEGIEPKLAPVAWLYTSGQKRGQTVRINVLSDRVDIYF
jgi:hypothetical protein